MQTYSETPYSQGRLIYRSGKDNKYQHEKIVVRVGGGLGKKFEAGSTLRFFAKTQYDLSVEGKLIEKQPVKELPFVCVATREEAAWAALHSALALFVDRATARWDGDWEQDAGNLGWKLEIVSSNEDFLEEVEEEIADLDDCSFQYSTSRYYDFEDGSKNFLSLFSEVSVRRAG